MQFLTKDDIKMVVDEETLDVIQQSDDSNLDIAEKEAIEEISGYLRSRYNVKLAFSLSGLDRNQQLVMITADIMLYHCTAWLPKRLGFDIREIRYNQWIKWLESVQEGKITPDLPPYTLDTDGDGETDSDDKNYNRFQFGCIAPVTNVY
ncbi:MAG: DUF1320 family protein [Bacteroidales bacterium]|nr:DUF1320 family protein [Bacteroidales bacterium]